MTCPQVNPSAPGPSIPPIDQLNRLLQRGMSIPNRDEALRFLSNVSFYRFRGYLEPYVDQTKSSDPRPFQAGTTFNAVLERYKFDARLRVLLLEAFNPIEISIRTQWTYHLSYSRVDGAYAHLKSDLFTDQHSENLASLREDYEKHGKDLHPYDDFQSCPIWTISEVMSFGQLSRWHGDTILSVRKLVAEHYQLHYKVLSSLLRHLTTIRNLCAHHERLWDRDFATKLSRPKTQMGKYSNPKLFFNQGETGKLYNTLAMIAYLTEIITGNSDWKRGLIALINRYPNIPQDRMGFVTDWEKLAIWQG